MAVTLPLRVLRLSSRSLIQLATSYQTGNIMLRKLAPLSSNFSKSNYQFSTCTKLMQEKEETVSAANKEEEEEEASPEDVEFTDPEDEWMTKLARDPKDRTRVIPLETSLAYMESAAYKNTYGDHKVWELYRRNFAKGLSWKDTRESCIRMGKINTGSPCPICRDEYLVVDYRNVKLLKQFIHEYNGQIMTSKRSHVCQNKYKDLLVAIEKARDFGLLTVDQPFIEYDYDKYRPKEN